MVRRAGRASAEPVTGRRAGCGVACSAVLQRIGRVNIGCPKVGNARRGKVPVASAAGLTGPGTTHGSCRRLREQTRPASPLGGVAGCAAVGAGAMTAWLTPCLDHPADAWPRPPQAKDVDEMALNDPS